MGTYTMAVPPNSSGTYALILTADCHQELSVGKLGTLVVQPGFYAYAGSALGSGGLAARIARHLRNEKKRHWHIDYLRTATQVVETWWMEGDKRCECQWAEVFGRLLGASIPLEGFGASDCGCQSHLHRFAARPLVRTFRRKLAEAVGIPVGELRIGAGLSLNSR